MHSRGLWAALVTSVALVAVVPSTVIGGQANTPAAGQGVKPEGLENSWDVRKIIADLQADTAQLQPLLNQLSPQVWVDKKGAPTTYLIQWQSAQQQSNDLLTVTKLFAQKTESLSQGLDTYFRLEALEVTERALAQGAQQYDTQAQWSNLNGMIAHNFSNRERLRNYLRDLALSTEQNYKIADGEAQRCRGAISHELPPASGRKKGKS